MSTHWFKEQNSVTAMPPSQFSNPCTNDGYRLGSDLLLTDWRENLSQSWRQVSYRFHTGSASSALTDERKLLNRSVRDAIDVTEMGWDGTVLAW